MAETDGDDETPGSAEESFEMDERASRSPVVDDVGPVSPETEGVDVGRTLVSRADEVLDKLLGARKMKRPVEGASTEQDDSTEAGVRWKVSVLDGVEVDEVDEDSSGTT